jgi:hypothetical protein
MKSQCHGPFELDNQNVSFISAYLFHSGGNENPKPLQVNTGKSFTGVKITGLGFLFEGSDNNKISSSIAEMQRLIQKDERNAIRIFPYIGGEEVNEDPSHKYIRYVINFGDLSEAEARKWLDLIAIVESKVKKERASSKNVNLRNNWWQFERPRPDLQIALRDKSKVLVYSIHQQHWSVTFYQPNVIFSHALGIFTFENFAAFCVIQSRLHEVWARFFGSSLEDRLRYTPTDCFETFPFPESFETNPELEKTGRAYYEFRVDLMVRNNAGLTKTYNRFHDPDERSPDILKLRELHAAMDRAVLDAYGWMDVRPTCEFLLDYEEDDEDEENAGVRRRKKPWRYRWPDEVRDEVLARLLALNSERAKIECQSGADAVATAKRGRKPSKGKRDPNPRNLFPK